MQTGVLFGHYKILGRISQGPAADVVLALDLQDSKDTLLALKRLRGAFPFQVLEEEIALTSALRHRALSPPLSCEEISGRACIASELVHGRTLRALFARAKKLERRIDTPTVLWLTQELCAGLVELHSVGAHGCICPDAVQVSFAGQPVLLGAGQGRAKLQARIESPQELIYRAPELRAGVDLAPAHDVFSLGLCCYKMLTGTLPQKGARPDPTLPAGAWDLLRRLLAADPAKRLSAARALETELGALSLPVVGSAQVAELLRELFPEGTQETVRLAKLRADQAVAGPSRSPKPPAGGTQEMSLAEVRELTGKLRLSDLAAPAEPPADGTVSISIADIEDGAIEEAQETAESTRALSQSELLAASSSLLDEPEPAVPETPPAVRPPAIAPARSGLTAMQMLVLLALTALGGLAVVGAYWYRTTGVAPY